MAARLWGEGKCGRWRDDGKREVRAGVCLYEEGNSANVEEAFGDEHAGGVTIKNLELESLYPQTHDATLPTNQIVFPFHGTVDEWRKFNYVIKLLSDISG